MRLGRRGASQRCVATQFGVATLSLLVAGCSVTLRLGQDETVEDADVSGATDAACGDLSSDPENCGVCGRRCPRGICVAGDCCIADRPASCETTSGPVCADLDTDPEHCGACGRRCGSGVCVSGGCCATGERPSACVGSDGSAICVDLETSPEHCGACGNRCETGLCAHGQCCTGAVGGICIPSAFEMWMTPAPEEVRWVHLIDANYDGMDDLFATCQVGTSVIHVPGRSDRALRVRQRIDTGRVGPGFAMGDIDRDGVPDFVSAVQGRVPFGTELTIWDGVAGGTYAHVATLPEDTNPNWTALLDTDADGQLDIAVRQAGRGCIAFRRGLGDYRFAEAQCVVPYATAGESEAIRAADDDGDGDMELYEIRYLVSGTEIWRHEIAGGTVSGSARVVTPLGVRPQVFVVRDLDRRRDGRADLGVLAMSDWHWSLVVRTPARGPVEGELVHDISLRDEYSAMQLSDVGDIDGDGVLDLVGFTTCGYCNSNVYAFFGLP